MIKKLFSSRRLIVGGLIAAALTVFAVGAWAVDPPTPSASPSPGASPGAKAQLCQTFIDRTAQNLGKTSDDLKAAADKARSSMIDDAVKAGKLTEAQAQKLRDRLKEYGALCAHGPWGKGGKHPLAHGYLDASASALHMSVDDVKAALKDGKTLHQLADQQHVTLDQFRSAVIADLTAKADAKIKDHLGTGTPPGWDAPLKGAPKSS